MLNGLPRILICGSFGRPSFEFCWLEWLRDNHYVVLPFDQNATWIKKVPSSWLRRILWRSFQELAASIVSKQFLASASSFQPDLILVVSGNLISPRALQVIREKSAAARFHFYGEDFFNPLNTTKTLLKSAFFYDHLFTTKTFNVPEMAEIGLRRVTFVPHGYRPNCHFPVTLTDVDRSQYGSDLSFVGTWEAERAAVLAHLKDFDLRIWGGLWHKAKRALGLEQAICNRTVYCEELSRVLGASKINLAFLRKANRDRHTSRTFEIPACGGFQLSERTDEVLSYFEEGREIVCFDSVEELRDKAHHYLRHEDQRKSIAAAGLARVRRSAYSYTDRLQTILRCYSEMTSP